jgi:bacteriocin biosynthesis cyclodehydratase domain-containing protein
VLDHHPPVHLPELVGLRRPRWRPRVPALWRNATTIQFGDDVVVDRLDVAHLAWLRLIDGTRTAEDLCASLAFDPEQARRLLRAMLAAGALDDASSAPSGWRFATVDQRHAAHQRWEAAMDQRRDPSAALAVIERRDHARVAIIADGLLRDCLAASVEDGGLAEVAVSAMATVLVLANAHHPDVPADPGSDRLDRPHLHVGVRGDRALIGPLVVPGHSSCLRCWHLHRRDADPHWPVVRVQWSHAGKADTAADPLLVRLAAAHAATLLRAWIDEPDDSRRWVDQAVELRMANPVGRTVPRPPHPLCGCRWAAA